MRNQDLNLLKSKLKHANYWFAVIALAFAFLSNVVRSYRWNMLIKPLGYKPTLVNTFCSLMIGYLTNLGLLRLGEVARCASLNKYENIPANQLFGTVVVERVIDVITIFLLLFIVVALQFDLMLQFTVDNIFQPMILKLKAYATLGNEFYIIVFIAIVVLVIVCWGLYKWFKKSEAFIKFKKLLQGFWEGIKTIRSLENPWLFIGQTAAMWFLYFMMSYICFYSFDATSQLGVVAGLTVMVMGGFGFAAPVQGGFGAFHAIVTQTLVLYSIAPSDGLAFAFLVHSTQTLGVVLMGALSFLILPLYNRNRTSKTV